MILISSVKPRLQEIPAKLSPKNYNVDIEQRLPTNNILSIADDGLHYKKISIHSLLAFFLQFAHFYQCTASHIHHDYSKYYSFMFTIEVCAAYDEIMNSNLEE